MVDRRMINTFLVQFLNPKSDEKTKHDMMSAMSKILAFSMEEKQQLGLVNRHNVEGVGQAQNQRKSMRSMFTSFLMGDDDFE